ncbi:unnamed protein product [Adineta steineri]|uniref:F-box domain-containing protein n=1 Tax=Adineta steineri TaxID=433720 RepID=A0A819FID6_9BILA|nr:unnamed protein product [Adineta steineri]CAF3869401.1 unnamed protein product [Adineta steineri]
MESSSVQLSDLPDEILMMIFKNLHNITLLYSLSGVNIHLNKIVHASIFANRLTLVKFVSDRLISRRYSPISFAYPLYDLLRDRICPHVLPQIHEKVKWFDIESSSMERILLSTNYPNLVGIALYNIPLENAVHLFSASGGGSPTRDENIVLFTHIFNTFTNLQVLNVGPLSIWNQYLSFRISPPTVISSTLLELYVGLVDFSDCLYLLDGRFSQLHTFHVNMEHTTLRSIINNREKLPNLKSFKLHCDLATDFYDELILPLLHRMSNLEKLDLALIVSTKKTLHIDGNDLKLNIINYMPLLNKFTFNIHSRSRFYTKLNLPSNEYIQETFKDCKNEKIISSIDYFKEKEYSQCHIYSCPYQLIYYDDITNNFPGGIFECVRKISLFDELPFEHDFFSQISQSFPFLEKLILINQKPQNNKQLRKLKNQNLSIIQYPYLLELDISRAHKDYYEQFLFDNKTCLPENIFVKMNYQPAKNATRNFRRISSRSNCAKMNFVLFCSKSKFPDHVKDYFPHARIV